nr:hypothetical protein [Tanacetum cinerariifolium]
MMLDSIDNGLLVYPTVEENRQTRPKKYSELTEAQQLQDDCNVQATNIILYGLPSDVYAHVNHQEVAKDIWDRVKLLMKGTELSYQEFNSKFLNALPPEWSKFVIDVKLAKSLYTTNYDQLYAYLSQYERHANEGKAHGETVHPAKEAKKFYVVQGEVDIIPQNAAFQTEDLDAYGSECDEISLTKAENQEMSYSEQTHIVDFLDNKITGDSNIIPYLHYLQESQDVGIHDTNSSIPNDLLVLSLVEQMTDHVANLDKENQTNKMVNKSSTIEQMTYHVAHLDKKIKTNKMVNESLIAELERYKERIAIFEQILNVDLNQIEKLIDSQMDDLIRDRNAKLAAFQQEIDTLKETISNNVKENVIAKEHAVIFLIDDEETLLLEEEKQAFWLRHSSLSETPVTLHTPVRIEAPSELPKCSVDKNIFEIQIKQLRNDTKQLLNEIMSKEIVHINANSVDIIDVKKSRVNDCTLKNELRKIKGINVANIVVSKPNATIAPGMFKLDIEPISARLKHNRDAHEVYIVKTKEYADTLRGFVE